MSGRARLTTVLLVLVAVCVCAGAFALGRASVDRRPPALPAARVVDAPSPPVEPKIVVPPRAVLP